MSSAIEVLKRLIEDKGITDNSGKHYLNFKSNELRAFREALLALEKQEKVKENILRIEECLRTYDNGDYFEPDSDYEHPAEWCVFDIKKVMKEVLERVGEQKDE